MRSHFVDGYTALKHPSPDNSFCVSAKCQELMDAVVLPEELPALPGVRNDCVKLEHAASATERTPIRASREDFNSFNFQMTAWGWTSYDEPAVPTCLERKIAHGAPEIADSLSAY